MSKLKIPLSLSDGSIEALKWLALVLMTIDHVNKYILQDKYPAMFYAGRLAAPLFIFILAFNLARPGALKKPTVKRLVTRLLLVGLVSTIPFIALGGLSWGWYPLNILFALLAMAVAIYNINEGRNSYALASVIIGGLFVEFWWPAIAFGVFAWLHIKRESIIYLALSALSLSLFYVINQNAWALLALPVIYLAQFLKLGIRRHRNIFYAYYPAHLSIIFLTTLLLKH